jgi:Winged helix DNA-binding domain
MRAPLTLTDLNRTLLARQLLLSRRAMPLVRALEAVAGIQAQDPVAPLFGLLARLEGFAADELTRALRRRSVVRGTLMRGTVHLVSARDYLRLEPAVGPLIRGQHQQYLRGRPPMPDVAERTCEALALAAEPVPVAELRSHFGEDGWWRIRREGRFLYAPVEGPRGGFGRSALFVAADAWLPGAPFASGDAALAHLVRRGLAGFGPMTLADLVAWSGLPAATLRPVVESLALVRRRDERDRELLDVPRRPVVRGDVAAPPRLLAPFDDAILSHADRTRVIDDDARRAVIRGGIVDAVVLVDGFVRGRWKVARARRSAELVIEAFAPIPRAHARALRAEAERTLAFAEPEAERRVVRGL